MCGILQKNFLHILPKFFHLQPDRYNVDKMIIIKDITE